MTEPIHLPAIKTKPAAVTLPSSKSISNCSSPLAALSDDICEIHSLLKSDDTGHMPDALAVLEVKIEFLDGGRPKVCGTGGCFPNRSADLFLGDTGMVFRPPTAVLVVLDDSYSLHGVPCTHERPIGDLVDTLRITEADMHYEGRENYLSLYINERADNGVHKIPIRSDASNQFLTAILMALPLTGQAFEIRIVDELISKPYIDVALKLMVRLGMNVANESYHMFKILADAHHHTLEHLYVEDNASSTSYFLVAGLVTGVPARVTGVDRSSMQGGVVFAHEPEEVDADVLWGNDFIEVSHSETRPVQAFDLDANYIPDAAMTLAVVALAAGAPCTPRNIGPWRVKEASRVVAMVVELRKLGAVVVEEPEAIHITPPEQLHTDAIIDIYDDHHIVMCFSPASPMGVPVIINGPRCTYKTFPVYFDVFAGLSVG